MARVDEIGAQAHPTKWRFMGRDGERGTERAVSLAGAALLPCPSDWQIRHFGRMLAITGDRLINQL